MTVREVIGVWMWSQTRRGEWVELLARMAYILNTGKMEQARILNEGRGSIDKISSDVRRYWLRFAEHVRRFKAKTYPDKTVFGSFLFSFLPHLR